MFNSEKKFYNNYVKAYLLSKHQLPNFFLLPKPFSIKLNISLLFTWNDELILLYWFLFKKFSNTFSVKVLGLSTATNQKIANFETEVNWKSLKSLTGLTHSIERKAKKKIGKTQTNFFCFSQYFYINFIGQYKSNNLDYLLDRFDLLPPSFKFYILYKIKHPTSRVKFNLLHLMFNLKNVK
jgi:hypothetical protein